MTKDQSLDTFQKALSTLDLQQVLTLQAFLSQHALALSLEATSASKKIGLTIPQPKLELPGKQFEVTTLIAKGI